ncbi:MAG: hypothetical protein KTR26_14045 [Flammeovirgaceae bacterium]|nr:hypothetical protein [Flammeovirgaceae bacterium]
MKGNSDGENIGLGLYMSRLAAKKIKGNIHFIENGDNFTHFQFTLPQYLSIEPRLLQKIEEHL